MDPISTPDDLTMDRRGVMQVLGAAAFVFAFTLPLRASEAPGKLPAGMPSNANVPRAAGDGLLPDSGQRFNGFIAISTDNIMTAITAQTEGGQGNSTGIPQVLAAELGADWSLVRCQFTTERRPEYVNPFLYRGLILTAGSTSISAFYGTLRAAAASVREMLISAGAKRWKVDPSTCSTMDSHVVHGPSGRRLTFGELAEAASSEPVPEKPRLRAVSEMPLVGRRLQRLDAEPKSTGRARYGLDLGPDDMLYAAVRHGSAYGSTIASIDDSRARGMPGVRLIMAVPQGVAVVADHYWQAVKALDFVLETYRPHPNDAASSDTLAAAMRHNLDFDPGVPTPGGRGNVGPAMKNAARIIEAEFWQPILCHASIEPVSCTASVKGSAIELWLSTKSPTLDSRHAAKVIGADPDSVIVHNEYQGGDFGRRSGKEHTGEAVLIAKAAGRPVKVIWSREEDIRMDQHRTGVLGRGRLGLDASGMPVAYEAKIAADGAWRSLFPWWYAEQKPLDLPQFSLAGTVYPTPNEAGTYALTEHPTRIGAFRGNNETHNTYILESLIDEAAHGLGRDPLEYRRSLLTKDPRNLAVIDRAAAIAGWGKAPAGHSQGVAFYHSEVPYQTRMALIIEVSKPREGIKLERVVLVCDSGLAINPMLAERCLEGGIVFGLSNVIHEEITLAHGAPKQSNYNDYRLLRFDETPDIHVEVISTGEKPGSFGEIGVSPVGAALGNAIFAATGTRLRSQPFSKGVRFA